MASHSFFRLRLSFLKLVISPFSSRCFNIGPHENVHDIEVRAVWRHTVIRDEGGKDGGQLGLRGLRGVSGGLIVVEYGFLCTQTVGQIFSHELHTLFLVRVLTQLES